MAYYNFQGKKIKVTKAEKDFMEKVGVGGKNTSVFHDYKYISPMSGKEITDRNQRKEEMKKFKVREVAPEEYNNKLKDLGFYDRRHPE